MFAAPLRLASFLSIVSLVVAGASSCSEPQDEVGDEWTEPVSLEQGAGLSCAGAQICSGGGTTYTAAYRIGATATGRSELVQFFKAPGAGRPVQLALALKNLRRFTNPAPVLLHVELHDQSAYGADPSLGPSFGAAQLVATAAAFDLAAPGVGGRADLTLEGAGLLQANKLYSIRIWTDALAETGATGSVLWGVGALLSADWPGSTAAAPGLEPLRASARRVPPAGYEAPRFMVAGTWQLAFALQVIPGTLPGAPTNVVATGGSQSATVSWSAPSSDGGSAITSYTIATSPGGATVTTPDGSTLSAAVTGLMDGTSYTFRVVATNAVGSGSASLASNAVTPASTLTIVTNGSAGRNWSNGTYAANCDAYRHPTAPGTYAGSTGDGLYTISPAGTPFNAYCDMTNDQGGWTLVFRLNGQVNYNHENADAVPPTPASSKAKFASSVINQISGQSGGNPYEIRLAGPVTQTLMRASEPFYLPMNTWPVTVQYDCNRDGVYEKTKTWSSWLSDRGTSEGASWIRDWVYPQAGQCNAWNGGNVMQWWTGSSTTPGTAPTPTINAPITATAVGYIHGGNVSVYVR